MRLGKAALMRIYTDERAKDGASPLFQAVVERARSEQIAGATVLRAVVGFGASRNVQRASILDLSGNLPLVIELVDEDAKLRDFWTKLEGLSDIGLVTLEELDVLHYDGSAVVGPDNNKGRGMKIYRVRHNSSGNVFYLLAEDELQAVDVVTLRLGDAEGSQAWTADRHTPSFDLVQGEVFDEHGQLIKRVDL